MKKVKTGIPGFDKLVEGGLPANSTILLCGTPGTAKSIFSFQFVYNGAKSFNEKSLYVSFEQTKNAIKEQAIQFGWNIDELEKKGQLHFQCIPVKDISHKTFSDIIKYIKENKIKRLVIDSLSTLSINAPVYSAINDLFLRDLITHDSIFALPITEDFITKRFIYYLIGELQEVDVTTILISEISKDSSYLSRDTISEFLSDGIIQLSFEAMGGKYSRSLLVRKMRHINNDEDVHPVEIGKKGLVIH